MYGFISNIEFVERGNVYIMTWKDLIHYQAGTSCGESSKADELKKSSKVALQLWTGCVSLTITKASTVQESHRSLIISLLEEEQVVYFYYWGSGLRLQQIVGNNNVGNLLLSFKGIFTEAKKMYYQRSWWIKWRNWKERLLPNSLATHTHTHTNM